MCLSLFLLFFPWIKQKSQLYLFNNIYKSFSIHFLIIQSCTNADTINSINTETTFNNPILLILSAVFLIEGILCNFGPEGVGVTGFNIADSKALLKWSL